MDYETLRYERDGHVTVLTYDRPEQRNAVSRQMNRELHDAWQRFRDAEDEFVLVITGEGDAFCAGWDLEDAAELGEGGQPDWDAVQDVDLQHARRVRLHAEGRRLQARDRGGQRLGGCGRARERPARRHPDRGRERRLRSARAALEHRRRRRHERPPHPGRRLRPRDGDDHHRPAGGGRGGPADRARQRGRARRARRWSGRWSWRTRSPSCRRARSARTRRRWCATSGGPTRSSCARRRRTRISMFARRDSHAIGARAFKEKRTPKWPNHGL